MTGKTEREINEKLAREEIRLRAIAEAVEQSKAIAEEIKAVLRKHGASLAEWNHNLFIVPQASASIPCGTFRVVSSLNPWP